MSFRTRLTGFFVLIVVVPMLAVGLLVYRLITDSELGKADARANGVATSAASLYRIESLAARGDAQTIARAPGLFVPGEAPRTLSAAAAQAGLVRVTVSNGSVTLADTGDKDAIAPGVANGRLAAGSASLVVTASEITAAQFAQELSGGGVEVVVREGGNTLASSGPAPRDVAFPREGMVVLEGTKYAAVTERFPGFSGSTVRVTVLSSVASTAGSVSSTRMIAGVFIAGFLLLAFSFSFFASRALQGQVSRFLHAARRLAGGDFSSRVPTEGSDEFAELGEEFNNMSSELARRLDELSQERARLRELVLRIGQTFASNLDRSALLDLALKTAIDGVQADCGRVTIRPGPDRPLEEVASEGAVGELGDRMHEAEREALASRVLRERADDELSVVSVPLAPADRNREVHGLITVAARERRFSDYDREVLGSLAVHATMALENVELHFQVRRQAVTDELTGLANHGRFQELLGDEIEQVRRYHHPVGLIMLDIDDFKSINDTYGHQQGDVVLERIANVLRENSRETDHPARYGGEEMAVILPHTDLEGAHTIAERIRAAIEALRIPRTDQHGVLRATASVGVAATTEGDKDGLIAEADAALYEAKRSGKNRTVQAHLRAANLPVAE